MDQGFFNSNSKTLQNLYLVADIGLIILAGIISNYLKSGTFSPNHKIVTAIAICLLVAFVVFKATGIYRVQRGNSIVKELISLLWAWSIVILVMTLFAYLTKTGSSISREWAIISGCLSLLFLGSFRWLTRVSLHRLRSSGRNTRNIAFFGAGEFGKHIAAHLTKESWVGVKIVGFFDDNFDSANAKDQSILGGFEELCQHLECVRNEQGNVPTIDQVWIALPLSSYERIQEIVTVLQNTSVQVHFVPDWSGFDLLNYRIDNFAGINIFNMSSSTITGADAIFKEIIDKVLSVFILVLISPVLLVIMLAIKVDSKGSIIFKQKRYGIDGKVMEVWKFRTMTTSDNGEYVKQATANDIRVTRVGKFLRQRSLDELPQFFNVLQGTMSIVGPRPHAVAHNELYRDRIPRYMSRHLVKPGITGWAQVNGWRGETDTDEKMRKRIEHDIEYIRNWSIWLDLKIILKTVVCGFNGRSVY